MPDKAVPYSILAEIYDTLMEGVYYEGWADFIDELIQMHHHDPVHVMELAAGTGSLAIALEQIGVYSVSASDKSAAMIEKARKKAVQQQAEIILRQIDFLNISIEQQYDVVVSVFDSVNYLLNPDEVHRMLLEVQGIMKPRGLFIFDFTTPKNSVEAIQYLHNEEGTTPAGTHFIRESRYDAEQQIHYNTFTITKPATGGAAREYTEEHRQRAYSLNEMQKLVDAAGFQTVAAYREFDLEEADDESLRVTMVLQCPDTPS